jgi:hypothetical protein
VETQNKGRDPSMDGVCRELSCASSPAVVELPDDRVERKGAPNLLTDKAGARSVADQVVRCGV